MKYCIIPHMVDSMGEGAPTPHEIRKSINDSLQRGELDRTTAESLLAQMFTYLGYDLSQGLNEPETSPTEENKLQRVTPTQAIGQGEEVTVYEIAESSRLVAKVPHPNQAGAWADQNMTIPQYQQQMYERLKGVKSATSLLPATLYVSDSQLGEVIVTDHLNPDHDGAVISLGDLDISKLNESKHMEQLAGQLRRLNPSAERINTFTTKMRPLIGSQLLDDASLQGLFIPPDAFMVVFNRNGEPSLKMNDFGTVLDTKDWSKERVSQELRSSYGTIMFSLVALEQSINNLGQTNSKTST